MIVAREFRVTSCMNEFFDEVDEKKSKRKQDFSQWKIFITF